MRASLYKGYIEEEGGNRAVIESVLKRIPSSPTEAEVRLILTEYALQLLFQARGTSLKGELAVLRYLKTRDKAGKWRCLVDDLLGHQGTVADQLSFLEGLGLPTARFIKGQDFLGFLYISLSAKGKRKEGGVYYTPDRLVKKMAEDLGKREDLARATVLDPCCGTGNFLLHLAYKYAGGRNLYGWDIDEVSIQLSRINVHLVCPKIKIETLYRNFKCLDALDADEKNGYDIILGNPPWGKRLSEEEANILRKKYNCAIRKRIETYDLFLEMAMELVKMEGMISFVLPEALLHVAAHREIREIMLDKCEIDSVSYLGNVFDDVQCPAVILRLKRKPHPSRNGTGCEVETKEKRFIIKGPRALENGEIHLNITDEEYRCLLKMEKGGLREWLKEQGDFALGVVTGDNRRYLSNASGKGLEPILCGTDIYRYQTGEAERYLSFQPEVFQQVAPEKLYRAEEKLLYRFVCGSLVFAYDDKGTLSLNSCNVLIPKIPGMDVKYVMAILNSRPAEFFYKKKFHSMKVLRSHIEEIPIPAADKSEQDEITALVESIMTEEERVKEIYEEIDRKVMKLYGFSDLEREVICGSLGVEIGFLPENRK